MRHQTVRLKDICKIITGKKNVNEGNESGKYPFFTCAKNHTFSNSYSFDCEAILVAGNGNVGQINYYKGKFEAYQRTYILSDFKKVNAKYLKSILEVKLITFLSEKALGNTIPYIKLNMLENFEFPLFPKEIQNKIVIKFDDFFLKIKKSIIGIEKNIRNSDLLFQSALTKIFNEIDIKPNQKILSEVCTVKDGTHDSPKYIKKGIPFITQKNIRKDGLNFDKIKFISKEDHEKFYKRSNVAFGDIIISMIGANRGMSAIVDDKRLFSIKNVGLFKKGDILDQNYLLYFLKSKQAQDYMKFVSKGGAQDFISLTALRNFPVIVPDREVQENIVKKIDSLILLNNSLKKNYITKKKLLNNLKDSIVSKVFNGEFSKLIK